MSSFLTSGAAARNNMGDNGSDNGGRDSYTVTGVLLLVYDAVEGMQNR